jgi:hypothetical protein
MPGQTTRYRAVGLVVLGIIVIVLGIFVIIGLISGDDTDDIDPQNGDVITMLP